MKKFILFLGLWGAYSLSAQNMGIGTLNPDPSAALEVQSNNKGLLIPRVALNGSNDVSSIPNPAQSLLIYNTATAGTILNQVTPGYYFWNGNKWIKFLNNETGWNVEGNSGLSPINHFIGTRDTVPLNFKVNNKKAGRIGLTNDGSTFLGYEAGANDNFTDNRNTFIGYQSGKNTTLGYNNSALGHSSMLNNTNGYNNVAVADSSLYNNIGGYSNVAIGTKSLFTNTTGFRNVAIGQNALYFNNGGNHNTAVGQNALMYSLGDYNTGIGFGAFVGSTNYNNCIAIAGNSNLTISASNTTRIGNNSMTSIGGQVSWTTVSDARVKSDIQDNVPGLKFINLLKPVTYTYDIRKSNEVQGIINDTNYEGKNDIEKIRFSGFLAQEVEQAANSIGYDFSGVDKHNAKNGGLYGLRYSEFVVPLVKAVQELNQENQDLKIKLQMMEQKNAQLEERIQKLENYLKVQN